MQKAELDNAIAEEERSKTRQLIAPSMIVTFPRPSCVFQGGLCGALNRDGSVAVAPIYDWVDKFYEGRALVRLNGLYGYIDSAGRVVIEPKYEIAGRYSRGLAEVSIKGMSGLIDLEGRQVLEPKFARVHVFTADAFWVNDGRRQYSGRPGLEELIDYIEFIVTNDIDAYGKWGLVSRTGEWIRKPEFQVIKTFDRDDPSLVLVRTGDKWGVIKPDGTWFIEPKFEALGQLYNGLAPARSGGQFGFIDQTGTFVIPPKFDMAGYFERDGLGKARMGTLWGLIDRTGAWVIEPKYQVLLHYPDRSIFWVRIGEKYGAIDRSGKLVVSPRFSQSGGICDDGWVIGFDNGKQRAVPREGMQISLPDGNLYGSNCNEPFQLEVNGKFGLVDRTLKPLTEVKFDYIAGFYVGAAIAKVDGKVGHLNLDGSWLIEPQFEAANNFVGEFAAVKLNGKWGCIRRNGTWLIEPQFQDGFVRCEVLAKMANDKFGPIGPNDKLPIDARIEKWGGLAPGFNMAKLDGKFGVINDTWEWVIEPRWKSYGMAFRLGLVAAKFDDKWAFIDASGALVIDDKYDAFSVFWRGIAWVKTGTSWCAIDRRGQRVPTLECVDTDPNPAPGTVSSRTRL